MVERTEADGDRTLEDLKREHGLAPAARHQSHEAESQEQSPLRNYVRDLVLGFNDGLVSIFGVTAGVAGAALDSPTILTVGVAAATAGALSMAAGEYISTKSQQEFYESERRREEEHLEKWPHLEKQELRDSLAAKGLSGKVLDEAVEAIASDRDRFLEYMMRDEFGVGKQSERSPLLASLYIAIAFVLGTLPAVTPYLVLPTREGLVASAALSLIALFVAGVVRAHASRLPPVRAGLEMVGIGILAGAITYGVGWLVGFQIPA